MCLNHGARIGADRLHPPVRPLRYLRTGFDTSGRTETGMLLAETVINPRLGHAGHNRRMERRPD
jgi:hypothetical protein